jgi:hypothetical protein
MIELPVSPQRVAVHLVENDVDKTRTGVLKSATTGMLSPGKRAYR